MANCQNCGAPLAEGATFCAACGAPAAQQPAAPQYQQPAPQYQQPAPQYQQPAPQYQQPAPQYQQPAPQYAPVAPVVDPSDHTADFDAKDISENKIIAMSAYLLGALGIIIALLAAPESKYASFHVRQALRLNIASILCTVVAVVPFIGWIAGPIATIIVGVVTVICFVHVCQGKAKDAPIISKIKFLN